MEKLPFFLCSKCNLGLRLDCRAGPKYLKMLLPHCVCVCVCVCVCDRSVIHGCVNVCPHVYLSSKVYIHCHTQEGVSQVE